MLRVVSARRPLIAVHCRRQSPLQPLQPLTSESSRSAPTLRIRLLSSSAASLQATSEMNVTRHNFEQCFAELQADIARPSCKFIAIDTEFTGLSPNEDEKERFLDTLDERYAKVKRAGESFLITQFGLSTVHLDDSSSDEEDNEAKFRIKTWNFYVFPRPYGQLDERFLCQASSLQFLSEHGFDFNKFIGDGIPYISLSRTKNLKKRLEKRIENMNKVNKNLSLSTEGELFQADVTARLDAWLADGAKKGAKLLVPTRNSFFNMIVHETVRAKANYLYSESVSHAVEVSFVSAKIKKELIEAKNNALREELEQAIGFARVIEAISESKKPVIGHNALLDFVYVFNQFYKPLPDTLAEFKQELLELFPKIYDTKHVALRSALSEKLTSTSLSSLFEYMRTNVTPSPEHLLTSDAGFEGYRAALKDESDGKENALAHEAGFDAMMTGVCFLGLLAHDTDGEVIDSISQSDRLASRLQEMEKFENQINLMISDENFLDLANSTQTIDRARVYRVSSAKRKIQQVRMEDLFQSSKVHRVVREGDQDAFVVLNAPSDDVNDSVKSAMGITITPYEQFMADQEAKIQLQKEEAREKQRNDLLAELQGQQATATPLAGPLAERATSENSSAWHRCTIS